MRSITWLIIGLIVFSFCSSAYVYQSSYALSGKLDAKTNDEFAQDSAKGSGDQVYTRTLESDYGFSKLFSRYLLENASDESNSYSMTLNAYGVSHGISFLGEDIKSSNLVKFDDNSGLASYYNMVANGEMDESLKLPRDNSVNSGLATSKIEGEFSIKSSFTEAKTPEYDTLRLVSELDAIDVDSILEGIPSSEDPDLNVTKMQNDLSSDLQASINKDVSPDSIQNSDDWEFGIGTVTEVTPPFRGLELRYTSAYNQSKADEVFAYRIKPEVQKTRDTPIRLGRYSV
jgi:hypothetical protein